MKNYPLIFFTSILFALSTQFVFAEKLSSKLSKSLSFKNILIPEAPPVSAVMAAYFDIVNHTNKKQTITKVESPQFQSIEIHSMTMKSGIMRMHELDTLSVKPKETLSLESAGLHLMLIRPTKILKRGDKVVLKVKLSTGETDTISTKVSFTK